MHPSTLAKRVTPLLFLTIVIFYLYGLGHLPLLGPDEPRYAQVAREMFQRNDFVTPTLGGHTWFEKPALLYWLMIISYKLFGVSEWSARLGPAICGLLTITAIWLVARKVQPEAGNDFGFWTALTAATSFGLIVFARAASFDITITMTTAWALSLFLLHEHTTNRRNKVLLLAGFYSFIGLSLIAKGLVGIVIPFGVLTIYYLLKRSLPQRIVFVSLLWGLPLAALVASLWYGPVIARHGWTFIDEFFIQHHFKRFLSNKYHHPQSIWFFPVIALMLAVPWSPFLLEALAKVRGWQWRTIDAPNSARIFSLGWFLVPIVFFSASGSKLPGYILPALPGAVLLIGDRVASTAANQSSLWPLRATGVICFLLGVSGAAYARATDELSVGFAVLAGLPLIAAGVFAVLTKRHFREAILTVGIASLVSIVLVMNGAASTIAERDSVRDLLVLADVRGLGRAPVVAQKGDDRSAEFYASGRVVYGPDGEPVSIDELSSADLSRLGEKVLVLIPVDRVEQFRKYAHVEVIADNGRMAILSWTTKRD